MEIESATNKHFQLSEFECKCRRKECDARPMKEAILQKLELLRDMWGKPLVPTSGRRCSFQNKKVGGASNSQHLWGNACDFYMSNTAEVKELMVLAEKAGFLGIGYGRRLLHIDDRKKYARWLYNI